MYLRTSLILLFLTLAAPVLATEADSGLLSQLIDTLTTQMKQSNEKTKNDLDRKKDQTESAGSVLKKEEKLRDKQGSDVLSREHQTKKDELAAAARLDRIETRQKMAEARDKMRLERAQKKSQNEAVARTLTDELKFKSEQEKDRDERAREKLNQESGK